LITEYSFRVYLKIIERMFGRHKNNNVEKPMFKIILAVLVFSLAACSDNKKSSSSEATEEASSEIAAVEDSSDFTFIEDSNLRDCLDNSGMTVQTLHTLVCSGKGVKSLQGIEKLPALKNVNLSHNEVSDISPLAEASGLEVLYATNNSITSIDALIRLSNLRAVSLRSNQLSDAGAFYNLPELKKLYVQGNKELAVDLSQLPADTIVAI
jgi:Leucine-rich repeat (LRR) protein